VRLSGGEVSSCFGEEEDWCCCWQAGRWAGTREAGASGWGRSQECGSLECLRAIDWAYVVRLWSAVNVVCRLRLRLELELESWVVGVAGLRGCKAAAQSVTSGAVVVATLRTPLLTRPETKSECTTTDRRSPINKPTTVGLSHVTLQPSRNKRFHPSIFTKSCNFMYGTVIMSM
jgi:hypothetical protein